MKYKEYGIYFYPCNRCEKGLQALHIATCILPLCANKNNYYDKNIQVDPEVWKNCLIDLGLAEDDLLPDRSETDQMPVK